MTANLTKVLRRISILPSTRSVSKLPKSFGQLCDVVLAAAVFQRQIPATPPQQTRADDGKDLIAIFLLRDKAPKCCDHRR